MKPLAALAAAACLASAAHAQEILYTHASTPAGDLQLATGAKTKGGANAPRATLWSELQSPDKLNANAIAGVSVHDGAGGASGAFRIADHFTVPPDQIWRIQGLRVFAYQPGVLAEPPTSPIDALNFRVLTASPDDDAAQVLFGDQSTNRYATAAFASLFRTFSTSTKSARPKPDVNRPIWQIDSAALDLLLPAGTYWLDWQLSSVNPDAGLFAPPATPLLSRGEALATGEPALHLVPGTPAPLWKPIEDPGIAVVAAPIAQHIPFQFLGELVPSNLADIAQASGEPGQDGSVDENDLILYLRAYMDNQPLADVCGTEGAGSTPDGAITSADLVAFIAAYGQGPQ